MRNTRTETNRQDTALSRMPKAARAALALVAWIAIWAVVARAIGSPIILATPGQTAAALGNSILAAAFWLSIGTTFLHVVLGLVCACVLGVALGAAASRWTWVDFLLAPAMTFIKSAPIVCFIVLLLVWFGSAWVDFAAVLLAVMPIYFFSTQESYRQRSRQLVDMLHVFEVPFSIRLRIFELPSLLPFFRQATRVAVGMSWKSGATAELIGLTAATIGEQIYLAKLTLDTASLLMWTIVIVLLGYGFEKLVLWLVERAFSSAPTEAARTFDSMAKGPNSLSVYAGDGFGRAAQEPLAIDARDVTKSFEGVPVVSGFSHRFAAGSRTCIMAPTGTGKTTLVQMLLGLAEPDEGAVLRTEKTGRPQMSAVFQEARLLPELTAAQNIALTAGVPLEKAEGLLGRLLDEEACKARPNELSGGMKRCLELCRALAANSGAVILDEPFAGLDPQKKAEAINLIQRELRQRTLILISHDAEDAASLGCELMCL